MIVDPRMLGLMLIAAASITLATIWSQNVMASFLSGPLDIDVEEAAEAENATMTAVAMNETAPKDMTRTNSTNQQQ